MTRAFFRLVPALCGVALATALSPTVAASDSLATPITSQVETELWPLEVEVQILVPQTGVAPVGQDPLPPRRVVVPDGHRTTWSSALMTPQGRRFFELDVVARQHPRDQVELEWDVVISRAAFEQMPVHEYVLHRLRLGPAVPRLAPKRLEVSRADIVSTLGEPITETVDIGGQTYEIRIAAHSLRG
jgi:hypothetical protein